MKGSALAIVALVLAATLACHAEQSAFLKNHVALMKQKVATEGVAERAGSAFTAKDRAWWAFAPIKRIVPPTVPKDAEVRNDLDRFIVAKLSAAGLTPAPPASRQELIRRVTFDLTGLPPTPKEIDAYLADAAPGAYERVVDRLLASPQYGQRMARQWLDLVRYADSDGYRADDYRPDAWRYRDYVIRSFNTDKPYTRFVQEQIAGDELFPNDPDAIIATGYLRHGVYEWNERDVRGQWETILNDLTDTTGDVFFGLGIQCARCHDHKFDPILQKDYFRLRAFFAPVEAGDRVAATTDEQAAYAQKLAAWNEKTASIRAPLAALQQPYLDQAEQVTVDRFPPDIQDMIRKPAAARDPLESELAALAWRQVDYAWARVDRTFKGQDKEKILALRRELAAMDKTKPAPLPTAFAACDVGPVAPPVFIPGKQSLGAIAPGFPSILDPAPARIVPMPHSTGRRSALALWLTSPANPLTARVIVNRAWQQHFGRGLAINTSDLGVLGGEPSHPRMLDWLAGWFIDQGYSLKKLHRLIVTSAAYQRSSEHPSPRAGELKDPEDLLMWRWQPRRLDSEQIRDAMLAVSGELLPAAGGPGVTPDVPRRTIFTRFMRNTRDPLADVFDAPLWFASSASRNTTTTPIQSLLLANSAFMGTRGRAFAKRLEAAAPNDRSAQIRLAYRLAFGREPSATEINAAMGFLSAQTKLADPGLLSAGQSSFVPGKVPYRDGQAAYFEPGGTQSSFTVNRTADLSLGGGFTIEAFIVPRSVADDGALRTIAAKWSGGKNQPGWSLGITGQRSRRRPLTIALELVGTRREGGVGEHPVFSDLNVQMNKPYYVAAAFTPAAKDAPGHVLFALKDLSNDDEPLLTAVVEHDIEHDIDNNTPLTLGARSGAKRQSFHGVIDDVRLSGAALPVEKLLYTSESVAGSTLGYWRFENTPGVFADSSGHDRTLAQPKVAAKRSISPADGAMGDFCNALLNSSEFLYVD